MKYKLSNIASKTTITQELRLSLKYPALYKPRLKIDGNKEQTLSIVTIDNPNVIIPGIWGILPHNYSGSWKNFQKLKTTLHVSTEELFTNALYQQALIHRRCLIIVTGFYMHYLNDSKVKNFLVEKKPIKPFYLAGIYNVLADGFITCSVINTKANKKLASKNNLYEYMPLVLPKLLKNHWLSKESTLEDIKQILSKPYSFKLAVNKIASK
ncbi:SOS response-associated peptidase family protein [Tenacibaculum sp. MEBiC06402]|uniref:SOS response-associated peptidase family protein n=1 Tax=unclassified Tenacibaculum TaxID=2635139 RepID=UPI003B9BC0C4